MKKAAHNPASRTNEAFAFFFFAPFFARGGSST
jgi:hypothetical protein